MHLRRHAFDRAIARDAKVERFRPLLTELDELAQAERTLKGSAERPSGTLAVAAHPQPAHHVLLPTLPRFHALYPEGEIDFRTVHGGHALETRPPSASGRGA